MGRPVYLPTFVFFDVGKLLVVGKSISHTFTENSIGLEYLPTFTINKNQICIGKHSIHGPKKGLSVRLGCLSIEK